MQKHDSAGKHLRSPSSSPFDAGSGSLRASADATDQLIAPMISATAPAVSIGASAQISQASQINRMTHEYRYSRDARQQRRGEPSVSRCVRSITISDSAMNAGIVASITAAMPEGTRCSAQNSSP